MAFLEAIAARFTPKAAGQQAIRATGTGSLPFDAVLPLCAEMSRAGRRFMLGNIAAITGIAPVTALPTTAATWGLWNASTTKACFFEEVGVYGTSGTSAAGAQLLACIYKAPAAVVGAATYTGTAITSCSGGGLVSQLLIAEGVTVTGTLNSASPNWYPLAQSYSTLAAAFPAGTQACEHRNLQGRLVLPPQSGLGLTVLAGTGSSSLFAPFAMWVEVESDLE